MRTAHRKVLVVEDNKSIRTIIVSFFRSRQGFQVVGEAADGQEAIERAVELRPDAIVLDLVMPKINGMAAAERIKEALPNAAIVVFTAYESASLRKHADKNIDAVISMSEGLEKLETELKRLLSG